MKVRKFGQPVRLLAVLALLAMMLGAYISPAAASPVYQVNGEVAPGMVWVCNTASGVVIQVNENAVAGNPVLRVATPGEITAGECAVDIGNGQNGNGNGQNGNGNGQNGNGNGQNGNGNGQNGNGNGQNGNGNGQNGNGNGQNGNGNGSGGQKVFVCKYVGTPNVDERLQTGNNPISVSVNAIPDYQGIGSYFADAQGRSYVLAEDNRTGGGQTGEPSADQCPLPLIPGVTPTPTPVTPSVTPTPTPVTPGVTPTPVTPGMKPTEKVVPPAKTVTGMPNTGSGQSQDSEVWMVVAGAAALAVIAAGIRKQYKA